MRNPNGLGSVYKLSGKRRKPYAAVVTTGYSIDGKQIRKCLDTFATRKEAHLRLLEHSKDPELSFKERTTFKEVFNNWFNEHKKKVSEDKSKEYLGLYKNYFYIFEDTNIAKIGLVTLQNFFNELAETKSTGYVKNIKATLSMIFNYALKHEIIKKNILSFIELPKHKKVIERKIFTEQEIKILWENVEIEIASNTLILIYTGMRILEFRELKIEDVDFENRTLEIKRSKTEAGLRTIPIHPKIFDIIKSRVGQVYVMENSKHNQESYTQFRYKFKNMLKDLNLGDHTIHDTRHTTASLLSAGNANPVSIKEIMGHTDYNITAKIYTHKNSEELQEAINSF